jgi:undecaprenyl-phosphate 4-deoxy-4-formamido-L-arabinose transferase
VTTTAFVTGVYGNAATLPELAARIAAVMGERPWRLRLVVDASPDDSVVVAERLAAQDPRIAVTALTVNVGQHGALTRGLADEPDAVAWVCLDADLQDPPEAVPALLAALGPPAAVFAGRRGAYETRARLLTGALHRRVLTALTGLPPDAGAFFAVDARGRAAVLAARAPSVVAAIGAARLPVTSVPVARDQRPVGQSAWTTRARLAQSVRTLAWAAKHRR